MDPASAVVTAIAVTGGCAMVYKCVDDDVKAYRNIHGAAKQAKRDLKNINKVGDLALERFKTEKTLSSELNREMTDTISILKKDQKSLEANLNTVKARKESLFYNLVDSVYDRFLQEPSFAKTTVVYNNREKMLKEAKLKINCIEKNLNALA